MAKITYSEGNFFIKCEFFENERVKPAPIREWDKKNEIWIVPANRANAIFIENEYGKKEYDDQVLMKILELKKKKSLQNSFPPWFKFKNEPRKHQMQALNDSWEVNHYAYFMEMRTGKTFVAINLAAARAMNGQINGVVVICPNGVKPVWDREYEEHCPIPYTLHTYESGRKDAATRFIENDAEIGLKVIVFNIEAMSQGGAKDLLRHFVLKHKALMVIDESSRIKNDSAIRTEKIIEMGGESEFRIILTGTPITQGIHDLYAQFRFLDWEIIGMKSYYTFKARYTVSGGFKGKKIVGYRNVEELMDLISPYCTVVEAKDVIDLPPQVYEKRFVIPTKEQLKAIDELGDPFMLSTSQDEHVLEVETVLERMIRYQQIIGGTFPYDDFESGGHGSVPLAGKNPKTIEMMEFLTDVRDDDKVIIWAFYRPEIDSIVEALSAKYGANSISQYHGGNKDTRADELTLFQEGVTRFFVSTQRVGSMGLELAVASIHIFYSNSFSYEDRKQAEARTNSSLQKKSVLYIDLVMQHKTDLQIHEAIERKESMATYVKNKLKGACE